MLSVAEIHVAYGRTPALTGPSLAVGAGEIVSIIGRNGGGKPTLVKATIALLRVTSGTIHLAVQAVTRPPALARARRRAIVLVGQSLEFAAALAQRLYVMEKGRIAREIPPERVMDEDIVRDYLAV